MWVTDGAFRVIYRFLAIGNFLDAGICNWNLDEEKVGALKPTFWHLSCDDFLACEAGG